MKFLLLFLALIVPFPVLAQSGAQPVSQPGKDARIGIISYWGNDPALYTLIPRGTLALINPEDGIFDSARQSLALSASAWKYKDVVAKADKRGVTLLGYVPTGYFNHGCNIRGKCQTWERIEAQVAAYFTQYPTIKGIFFDEASPAEWNCEAYVVEYAKLRDIVRRQRPDAQIAFNAGLPSPCVVAGAEAGDIVVLFESDGAAYVAQYRDIAVATKLAHDKGVLTWQLIYGVHDEDVMLGVVKAARAMGADFIYVTDIGGDWQHGENTWGDLPRYWKREIKAFEKENQ